MGELQQARTLEVIGAEIRAHAISMEFHMRGTVNEAVEIGRRLVEARDVAKHGEWMAFLERETPFSHDKANNLIKVFEAYGDQQKSLFGTELSNSDTYRNLSFSQALALLALPSGEREEFVETHAVEAMTTRELQAAIRERDEAKADAAYSKKKLDELNSDFEESQEALLDEKARTLKLSEKIRELESRPVDVAVQVDEEACRKAADEARRKTVEEWQKKTEKLDEELRKTEEKLKEAREKVKQGKEDAEAGKAASADLEAAKKAEMEAKAEAEQLRAELEQARREQKQAAVAGDAELAAFQLLFDAVQSDVGKMRGILLKVRGRGDGELGGKLAAALGALADAVRRCAE